MTTLVASRNTRIGTSGSLQAYNTIGEGATSIFVSDVMVWDTRLSVACIPDDH